VPWALILGYSLGDGSFDTQVSLFLFSFLSPMSASFPARLRQLTDRSDAGRATRLLAAYDRHPMRGRTLRAVIASLCRREEKRQRLVMFLLFLLKTPLKQACSALSAQNC